MRGIRTERINGRTDDNKEKRRGKGRKKVRK
jgi:hypothetical protein